MRGRGSNLKKCGSMIQQVRHPITRQHFAARHMAIARFRTPPHVRKFCGGTHLFKGRQIGILILTKTF
jgi:hypothetical protein